jgi:hypothetical protein
MISDASDADLVWCDECGRGAPWKHPYRPTLRRRLIAPVVRVLDVLTEPLISASVALRGWADAPHRATYEKQRWGK